MKRIITAAQAISKWKIFSLIILMIIIIGTIISIVTHFTFIKDDIETRPRIAVVIPVNSVMGTNFKQGAELYVESINSKGGYNGRRVELVTFEETSNAAEKIIADKRIISVAGYFNSEVLKESANLYEQNHIPVVTPLFLQQPLLGVTSVGMDLKEQARFVANYARNIQQQRLMYVIREAGAEFDPLVEPFLDVYKRFDIPVKQVWTISKESNVETQLQKVLEDIKNIDIGAVYIATNSDLAARLVKGIRDSGNALELYGSAQLASNDFVKGITTLAPKDTAILTHGIITATPVLFDTANEKAQHFQNYFQQKFGQSPDWVATYAYVATKISLSTNPGVDEIDGIIDNLKFVEHQAQIPVQMGIYSGDHLISAPVQLLPIAKGASFNYIEALRQGRVLYVNDRFMFKTNVVYVGVAINEISDLNLQDETVTIDMLLWFRYRGNFSPENLEVFNAIEPVVLNTPEESRESDDVQYRRYHIKQKFRLNFTDAKRAYGQHIAGISFRHKQLNYNNLMYVVDVLGMPTGNALTQDLQQRKVVHSRTGWEVSMAWESQDLIKEHSDGAPQYVGMTGEQPLFSKIILGALLKPATANPRDIISGEYFIYIAIFGLLGIVSAVAMDARYLGKIWSMQSWLLRLIFWPLALLSIGNLILDWAFSNVTPASTRIFVIVYESSWWLVGAWLLDIGIRRFIWESLAKYTESKIPNVIKLFTTILLFAFAFSGILIVVFNQSPTSLLATSGVLAMVVGMAVKDIIANVFSGIILNFERPFKVGDQIKINNIVGDVKDITWRTTRVESRDGQMVSLANGKVTEAFMENYSQSPNGLVDEIHFYTTVDTDPNTILAIITDANAQAKSILRKKAPKANYKGVVNVDGFWVNDFTSKYYVENLSAKSSVRQELWLYIHQKFSENNISAHYPT